MSKSENRNKYKVMIIDDDLLVIDDIKNLVNWEELGLEISAVCENGQVALELMANVRPNIVIADIAMPVINGLEFSERALKYDKSIKIILLTAYSKFDYVKKAISMGVTNYILKHELDEEVLKNEFLKLRSDLDDELNGKILKKQKILEDFLSNPYSDFNKEQFESNIYSFTEDVKSYFMSICLNKPFKIKHQFQYHQGISKNLYMGIMNIQDICYFEKEFSVIFLPISNYKVVALIYSKKRILSENLLSQMIFNFALHIKEKIAEIFDETINVVVSSICNNINELCNGFKSICNISNYSIFINKSRVFYDIEFRTMICNHGVELDDIKKLCELSLEGNSHRMVKDVEKLWNKYCREKYDIKALKELCEELKNILNKKNKLPNMIMKKGNEFLIRCEECTNTSEILELFNQCINELEECRMDEYSYKTAVIIDFIHKEYANQITIDDIACRLGLSGEYLNKYFKKEVNKSFTKYLTEYRMRIAKELLESGNYKIYEVSDMVGYKTTQYFSSIFKKVTGITPSDCIKQ